jgi:hypothetical protein
VSRSLLEFVTLKSDAGEDAVKRDGTVTGRAIQDLVGRVMVDEDFLAELVRDPAAVLAGYELTDEERAVIMHALGHGAPVSDEDRADLLQNVLLKRWAT